VWPPCYLAGVCDRLASDLMKIFGERFFSGLCGVSKNLEKLATSTDESGYQWEGPCAAAVLLRMLQSDLRVKAERDGAFRRIPPIPAKLAKLLPLPVIEGCQFGGHIVSGRWKTTDDIANWLQDWLPYELESSPSLQKGTAAFLLQPSQNSFHRYDFFILVIEDGKVADLWAYQCRRGPKRPTTEPGTHPAIQFDTSDVGNPFPDASSPGSSASLSSGQLEMKCVWLRGRAGETEEPTEMVVEEGTRIKWIVPSDADQKLLFGVSLERTCPSEFLSASLDHVLDHVLDQTEAIIAGTQ